MSNWESLTRTSGPRGKAPEHLNRTTLTHQEVLNDGKIMCGPRTVEVSPEKENISFCFGFICFTRHQDHQRNITVLERFCGRDKFPIGNSFILFLMSALSWSQIIPVFWRKFGIQQWCIELKYHLMYLWANANWNAGTRSEPPAKSWKQLCSFPSSFCQCLPVVQASARLWQNGNDFWMFDKNGLISLQKTAVLSNHYSCLDAC